MGGAGAIFGLAGGIASAAGSMSAGGTRAEAAHAQARAEAEGDVFDAKQHLESYFEGMTKSFQTDTAMTQQLGSTLANIVAIRGSSGADISSPSGEAITNRTLSLFNQDIARTTLNIQQEARRALEASEFFMKSAYAAIEAGRSHGRARRGHRRSFWRAFRGVLALMRSRLPEPEQPRPPRDSDYERIPHVPVLWGSPVERCKRELLRLFRDGPVEENKFHHVMMRQGWEGAEVTSASAALGVREGSTLFMPNRGRVRMLALPGQPIAENGRSNYPPPRRSTGAKPRQIPFRLGGRRVV